MLDPDFLDKAIEILKDELGAVICRTCQCGGASLLVYLPEDSGIKKGIEAENLQDVLVVLLAAYFLRQARKEPEDGN